MTEMRDFSPEAEQVDTAPYHDASQKRRGGISIARDRKREKDSGAENESRVSGVVRPESSKYRLIA